MGEINKQASERTLALLGGTPLFAEPVHVGRPNLGDRENLLKRINSVLDRRWLTNDGPLVREFEEEVASVSGVNHCIATANGSIGLILLLKTLGVAGDALCPSFTFIATPQSIEWAGLRPVFTDISPADHLVTPDTVREVLTPQTSVVVAVHLWGSLVDMPAVRAALPPGTFLVADAAHAFGTVGPLGAVGSLCDASVFSFHATKFINTFEGGAVVTNDDNLAAELRLRRNFSFSGYDDVVGLGMNAKMSEIAAAQGLTMLEAMPEILEHNYEIAETYREVLDDTPGVRLVDPVSVVTANHQYIVLEIDAIEFGASRDQLLDALWSENVFARRYFYPGCHRMRPYRERLDGHNRHLPVTASVAAQVLVLPTGSSLMKQDAREIAHLIHRVQATDPDRLRHALQNWTGRRYPSRASN